MTLVQSLTALAGRHFLARAYLRSLAEIDAIHADSLAAHTAAPTLATARDLVGITSDRWLVRAHAAAWVAEQAAVAHAA